MPIGPLWSFQHHSRGRGYEGHFLLCQGKLRNCWHNHFENRRPSIRNVDFPTKLNLERKVRYFCFPKLFSVKTSSNSSQFSATWGITLRCDYMETRLYDRNNRSVPKDRKSGFHMIATIAAIKYFFLAPARTECKTNQEIFAKLKLYHSPKSPASLLIAKLLSKSMIF